jgi:hypothetical protein
MASEGHFLWPLLLIAVFSVYTFALAQEMPTGETATKRPAAVAFLVGTGWVQISRREIVRRDCCYKYMTLLMIY